MKFAISFAAVAALLSSSTCQAFSPAQMNPVSPGNPNASSGEATDTGANDAMSQYEAALKAAFEQASASAVPSTANQQQEVKQQQQQQPSAQAFPPVVIPPSAAATAEARIESNTALLEQVQQQEQAIDQYEAALRAALESSSSSAMAENIAVVAPSTIVFGQEQEQAQQQQQQQPDWANISLDISSKIKMAESKIGGPLDAAAKGEIVGTVLAGSAVLGTAAINSPLLMGAALGYAGTHVLGGKRGEALAEAGTETLKKAIEFTRAQLKEEGGDISKASARIVEHLQNEALKNARVVTEKAQLQAHQVSREITNVPSHLVSEGKKIVDSEEVRQMPKRTFQAVQAFLGSEEVKRARESVVKSIKDGLESEELRAVKERATRSLKDI